MIIPCDNEKIDIVFDYIGEDYGKCVYIYIDLKKYGLDDPNFNVWIQYNENDNICAIISEYYGGIQVYSKNYDLNAEEIANFIKEKDSHMILAAIDTLNKIKVFLSSNYTQETGIVAELKELKYPSNSKAYSASIDELAEIVEIVAEDENLGKPHGYESLYKQYLERKEDNFGRNFILRDDNNRIICHAATYAELPELAVISGVITSIPYRGKGFSKEILSSICKQLKLENKRIFSFYYILPAEKMHKGVGFEPITQWSKLIKKE